MTAAATFELAQKLYQQIGHVDVYERMAVLEMMKTIDAIHHNEQRVAEMAKYNRRLGEY